MAMKLNIRRSDERGCADHGWLRSRHTFSFADYYDPAHMGFRSLRVINEDHIAPGAGFPTHPHRDMEIFSYFVSGVLEHRDSMGNRRQLLPGQIQLMRAGKGVTHSEFNPSPSEQVHLLQIWIQPREIGLTPAYTEWVPSTETQRSGKVLVISPDGREGSALIEQAVRVYLVRLGDREPLVHDLAEGHGMWVQLVKGAAETSAGRLDAGDALSSEQAGSFSAQACGEVEALLFDFS
jgi:redox-sensitive bicupin YhaK (pirin superfamily)